MLAFHSRQMLIEIFGLLFCSFYSPNPTYLFLLVASITHKQIYKQIEKGQLRTLHQSKQKRLENSMLNDNYRMVTRNARTKAIVKKKQLPGVLYISIKE